MAAKRILRSGRAWGVSAGRDLPLRFGADATGGFHCFPRKFLAGLLGSDAWIGRYLCF